MTNEQPKQPPENPELGPKGPRTPYPADGSIDPKGPASGPDYFPGTPGNDSPRFRQIAGTAEHRPHVRPRVSWHQAH